MMETISVLVVLAGLSFFLEVIMERLKSVFPFIGGSYKVTILGKSYKLAPVQFITLALGIGLMFAINQPISLFGALGYEVAMTINHIVNGVLISGGSNYIYDIIHRVEKLDNQDDEE